MLVLLRVTVGWHFLYSGIWKYDNPSFSSVGFLSQAKGPFAEKFQERVLTDHDGRVRLKLEHQQQLLKDHIARFQATYSLTDEQKAQANLINQYRLNQLEEFFADNAQALTEYFESLDALRAAQSAPTHMIPYEQKRNWDQKQALQKQANGWLAELQAMADDFHADLARVLSDEQRDSGVTLAETPDRVAQVDQLVMWSNIIIGVCLMAGLFTRLAALAGGLFLASIVALQPDFPGLYPPPHPSAGRSLIVNKEFIEMMVLFTLVSLPVGRWGGLDFFIHHLLVRPIFGKKDHS
jgi:uncharacterized membrane protein YphA (DoxX/SURF4 family)